MRELERKPTYTPAATLPENRLTIVGAGRLGGSLARAAGAAGLEVTLADRETAPEALSGADVALLAVPDGEIGAAAELAAAADPPPRLIGHSSGATPLDALAPVAAVGAATFSVHPLQSFADADTSPQGAPCAVAGSDAEAVAVATELAERLGMRPFEIREENRAAYHAAASLASNFLVALEESAAELLSRSGTAGRDEARELLAPLVLHTAANWSELGGAALTGPIARGDEETVARQRAAIETTAPELLALFDALAERARKVAREEAGR